MVGTAVRTSAGKLVRASHILMCTQVTWVLLSYKFRLRVCGVGLRFCISNKLPVILMLVTDGLHFE